MICQATQAYVTKIEALQKEMEPYKKQTENQEGKPKPWHINSFTLSFYFDLLLWRPYTSFNIVLKKVGAVKEIHWIAGQTSENEERKTEEGFCKIPLSSLHILHFQIGCLYREELEQNVFVMMKQKMGS